MKEGKRAWKSGKSDAPCGEYKQQDEPLRAEW